MVPQCSDKIARVSSYSSLLIDLCFRLQGYHLLWPDFPDCSASTHPITTTGLVPFRSPLLRESRLISFPPVTEMFHFTGSRSATPMYSEWSHPLLNGRGYPIRKSPDHSVFAAPRSLSQLITSFFACWHQGIHHVLLVACSILRLKNLYF